MRVLLTGAHGFLGHHTRVRLQAMTEHQVVPVGRADWGCLADLADGVDAIVHVAGVNRGGEDLVEAGNVELAHDVAIAAGKAGSRPRLIFANSVQVGNGTAYARGKQTAAQLLADAAAALGTQFVDVRLPNLFGEGARPNYNSFVATFVADALAGRTPQLGDRPIALLHVQDAAQVLIEALELPAGLLCPAGTQTTVGAVHDLIQRQNELYRTGEIPSLARKFEVDMFNTLRAAAFPTRAPIALQPHRDDRGVLVESVRGHGGAGQAFVSHTRPGVTRGDHFHLSKVERFVVLCGQARISLRRVFGTEVVSFDVDGQTPVAVDMPTMWVHNITNVADSELTTLFWAHPLHDPSAPDTYWEKVQLGC